MNRRQRRLIHIEALSMAGTFVWAWDWIDDDLLVSMGFAEDDEIAAEVLHKEFKSIGRSLISRADRLRDAKR